MISTASLLAMILALTMTPKVATAYSCSGSSSTGHVPTSSSSVSGSSGSCSTGSSSSAKATSSSSACFSPGGTCSGESNVGTKGIVGCSDGAVSYGTGGGQSSCSVSSTDQKSVSTTSQSKQGPCP
jgi:hypothetical protein